jgi:hypothetical protein
MAGAEVVTCVYNLETFHDLEDFHLGLNKSPAACTEALTPDTQAGLDAKPLASYFWHT